jgi:hypothetical protein
MSTEEENVAQGAMETANIIDLITPTNPFATIKQEVTVPAIPAEARNSSLDSESQDLKLISHDSNVNIALEAASASKVINENVPDNSEAQKTPESLPIILQSEPILESESLSKRPDNNQSQASQGLVEPSSSVISVNATEVNETNSKNETETIITRQRRSASNRKGKNNLIYIPF